MGGVFNTVNLHLYHYAGNNPVKYTDPDGKETFTAETTREQYDDMATYDHEFFREDTWNSAQEFFRENPDGAYYRAPGEFRWQQFENKDDIDYIDPNSAMFDTFLFLGAGKVITKGIVVFGRKILIRQIPEFVGHGGMQSAIRGFTPSRIAKVLKNGIPTEGIGRYGPQIRYTLGENTVVIATSGRNAGKIITTFSKQVVRGIKGYWVEP
jgi:hypothetical protein